MLQRIWVNGRKVRSLTVCSVFAIFGLLGYQNCGSNFTPSDKLSLNSLEADDAPEIHFLATPSKLSNSSAHIFAIALSKPHSSEIAFHCRLDGAVDFTPCQGELTIADLTDGVHELSVYAVDRSGNQSAVVQHSWMQDKESPTLSINQSPPSVIGTTQTVVEFSAFDSLAGLGGFECSLDGGAYTECLSPHQLIGLNPGARTLMVRAYDKASNVSIPVSVNWTVLLGTPTVTIDAKPSSVVKVKTATFNFSGTDGQRAPLSQFECRIDGGMFAACMSPRAFSNLAEGQHAFEVRGIDSAGKVSSPINYTWQVDSVAPNVVIGSGPSGVITSNSAVFMFSVTDSGSGVKSITCQLDSGPTDACTNSKSYSNLSAGSHSLVIEATDLAGNKTTVQRAFTYTPPAPTPSPTPVSTLDGKALYANNCAGCHGPIETTSKRNATFDRIKIAIGTIGNMASLSRLSDVEVRKIEDALNTSSSTPSAGCPQPTDVGSVAMQRLNQNEYRNTIRAITGVSLAPDSKFPTEEVGEFPNNSRILILNSIQLAWYLDTAISVVDTVMASSTLKPAISNCDLNQDACWKAGVSAFAEKSFRRPPASDEITRLQALYLAQKQKGLNSTDSFKVVLQSILVSPQFLYRNVKLADPTNPTAWKKLDAYELASRVSYFIWGESPDSTLYGKAKTGQILTPSVLKTEIDRLMADDRAALHLSRQFLSYWWGVTELSGKSPNRTLFPEFNDQIKADMATETELVFRDLIKTNGRIEDLLTMQSTYLNENLARFYGVAGVTGAQFRKVSLAGSNRTGVLTHGSVMVTTSHSTSTSIVRRGSFVANQLQCITVDAPPADVGTLPPSNGQTSIRQRLEAHRANPVCASCHNVMDPPGFGLENFNAIGLYRTKDDDGFPVDTKGTLISGRSFSTATELASALVSDTDFHRCASSKLVSFSLGRTLESFDQCMVTQISNLSVGKPIRDVVYGIVSSPTFQNERGD